MGLRLTKPHFEFALAEFEQGLGTGYPAGTDISIWLLGPQAETVSDGSGSFTKTFKVPDTPFTGIQEVSASGGAFSDRAQFTIEGS